MAEGDTGAAAGDEAAARAVAGAAGVALRAARVLTEEAARAGAFAAWLLLPDPHAANATSQTQASSAGTVRFNDYAPGQIQPARRSRSALSQATVARAAVTFDSHTSRSKLSGAASAASRSARCR